MGQIRKAKGVSHRKHTMPLRRHMKVVVTYLLLIAIIFSNMSNPLMNVFAGQKKEEFRIHADELQRAAEEALEEGNVVEEPLDIYTKDSSLQKEYDELFAADGTLYEIFPDYERENDLDEMDLRVFLRLSPEADPKSYVLTGEETFIFLYINGGDETAAGRINIDGYISGICSLKSYGAVFDKEDKGNGGGHHDSNITIDSETEAPADQPENGDVTDEETKAAEDKKNENAADSGEKISQDDKTDDSDKNDAVDEDKSHESDSDSNSDAADTGNTSDTENKDDSSNKSDQDSSENEAGNDNGNDGGNTGNDTSDNDTSDNGSDTEDSADAGSEDTSDNDNSDSAEASDTGSSDQEDSAGSSDTVASISVHPRYLLTDVLTDEEESFVTIEETEEETEAETEAETEPEKETEAEAETTVPETEEETTAEETKPSETKPEESLPQETKEETQPAKENEVDSTTETGAAAPDETKPADDTKLSDVPDAVNKAEEESEPSFDRVGALKGETYNLASLDQTVTIRAFTAKLSDMGYDKDELESQGHIIDYMIDPTGSAELVKAPKLVRDGAEVVFGVIPQAGYRLMEVTANGEELEEVEAEDIASPSNASRADEAVYYVIPEVLEDQEVEIFLEEEIPGSHPAFEYAETLNGVTVSISAAEGILPEGTTAKIAEVTENVENAVKEKVESEAAETDAVEVKSVLAYDITLYDAQGNVLNDSWSRNGYVKVSFSGAPIEEKSKEAAVIEISHLDTDVNTTESVVTADEIKGLEQVADEVVVGDEASVESVEFEAKHFSTYTITFNYTKNNRPSQSLTIALVDTDGAAIGNGNYSDTVNFNNNSGTINVEKIATDILNADTKLAAEYIFKEAKTDDDLVFTQINYSTTGRNNNKKVVITVNTADGSKTVTSVKFIFEKLKYVDASITVSGMGTVEAFVGNESKGVATAERKLEGIQLLENSYTLKFTPGTGQGVAAIYVNNQTIPLSNVKNNTCEISGISGTQDIRVVFSPVEKLSNLGWSRSDTSDNNRAGASGSPDNKGVIPGSKDLQFKWSTLNTLKLNNTNNVWDKGTFYPDCQDSNITSNYATWRYLSGNDNYELRRFQTTFQIPEGYSTSDYIRLKSIRASEYGDYNNGNIIPINDDIFIFIYKKGENLTDINFKNYLAFWTGTIATDKNGADTYWDIPGTAAYHEQNTPFFYTDGWYCEADIDNVGSMMFKNYPNADPDDTYVLDVFVGDYSNGGGMDPLELEFIKTTGSPVTIRYYKDQITTPDDNTHFLGSETIKGLMLGQEIDLSSYGDGSYLNKYKPSTGNYLDGAQSPLPYIVREEAGVINVLYVTQKQPVRVEYYTRDNESVQEADWTKLGELPDQEFPLGWKYEDAVYKEYGKNTWLTEAERDWYDDGLVKDGTTEITKDTDVIKVVYTKKHGDFQITKILQGNTQPNAVSNVQFQLYKSDANWSTSELYGNPVNAVQNGTDVTTGTIDFTKLPGGYYILKETQTAPGYNALTFGIRLQITLDDQKNVVCKFYDSNGNEITTDGRYYNNAVEMKDEKLIIYNKAGVILPDTGGRGLDEINRIGWSVILTSVIFAGFQLSQTLKRKREE